MAERNPPPNPTPRRSDQSLDPPRPPSYGPPGAAETVLAHAESAWFFYSGLEEDTWKEIALVVAESVLLQFANRPRLATDAKYLKRYTVKSVFNAVARYRREKARSAYDFDPLDEDQPDLRPSPLESTQYSELKSAFESAVSGFKPRMRLYYRNFHVGFTPTEVAERHGVSVKTVESSLAQARAKLRVRLQPFWDDLMGRMDDDRRDNEHP